MANKNSVSKYFWSTLIGNIDDFGCGLSGVIFIVRFMMLRWTFLHTIEHNYLELLVLKRKVYNNDDIAFFSVY